MTSRRSAARTLLAMLVAVAALMALPAFAGAKTPITAYSALPSTRQAGGHPDVELAFRGRKPHSAAQPEPLQLRGRERRDPFTSRRDSSATRTRLRSARSPSSLPTNARSTPRSGSRT